MFKKTLKKSCLSLTHTILMVVTKTFQLTLKPSSLNVVVTHDFEIFQNNEKMYARDYKEWFLCVIYNLNGC